MSFPNVGWSWWLCRKSDLGQIADLTACAHNKKLELMLNRAGKVTCSLDLENENTKYIEELTTCLICYRNTKPIFGGPIYICNENTEGSKLEITAQGWYEYFNKRLIHTGLEWQEMAIEASERPILRYPSSERETELKEIESQYESVLAEKFYVPVATESAQQLYYANTPMATIANDLIIRANIDKPTGITLGEIAPTNSINLTLQQFQNVGEEISKITAIESAFDFYINPLTRKLSTYRNEIRGGIAGLGVDRGSGIRFTYPGNCTSVSRNSDGTKTQNRTEVVGQYGVGKAESVQSVSENGLFETVDSLPEVTNSNILIAYANIETDTLEKPFKIINFNPRSVNDGKSHAVPRPFEDYEIGDVVYSTIEKGPRLRVGLQSPQPVRIYGLTVSISDDGVETISNVQTTYSQ